MPKRSQYSSCDACRKSKRRCEPQSESGSSSQERSTCSNCLRLRLNCTYHFATCKIQVIENRKQQKESQKRRLSNANSSSSAIWGLESLLDASSPLELEDKALFSLFPEISEPSHNPFSFSPFERLGDGLTMEDQNRVLLEDNIPRDPTTTVDEYEDLSDLSPSNIQPEIEAAHVSLSPTKFSDGSWSFQSLASPLTTLNQSYMSRILHETLHRIYNNIMFLSVSSFLGSECNPFTDTKYSLEENENQGSIFCKISDSGKHLLSLPSWSGKTSLSTPSSLIQTMLGAVSFLDHFGTLYGNGLSKDDHQRAETALGHAFHAFSSQWITGGIDLQLNRFSKSPPPIQAECSHQDIRAYYWHKARSSLAETKRVKCFKIVYAMLLFDMTTPFGKLSLLPDEQQNDFLQECIALLCPLRVKVLKYCENLGSTSTYAGTLRVGLGIISWLAFLRDTMTSATSLKPPIFDSVSLESNGGVVYTYKIDSLWTSINLRLELSHKLSTSAHNLLDTDDAAIFVNCSSAISQMVFLWRRLHPKLDHKLGNYSAEKSLTFITTGESHEDRIRNFINVASALDDYEMKYKDLMRYTLVNHQDFSPRTKFFSCEFYSLFRVSVAYFFYG